MIKSHRKNQEQKERAMFEGPSRNRDIMVAVAAAVIVVLIVWYYAMY
jgi:hypothetical protein